MPDFKASVRFEDGVKETIYSVLNNPELQKEDPEFDKWCDRVIETLEKAKKEIQNNG